VLRESGLLLQSSGTTGLPKIVCRPVATVDASARQIVESVGLQESDHVLMCVPISHSYGLEHGLLATIASGAATHLTPGFDVGVIGRELVQSSISILPAVPAVFEMLVRFDDLPATFPRLRLTYSAGGSLPVGVNNAFQKRFGARVGQIFGASEIGSVTFADPRDERFDPISVGRAMPGVEMKVDADSQLIVRAPSQMRGYLGEETSFTPDGYFPTGDLARIDEDGQLTLTGRLKLLIDIAGRKVNPLEVEQAIMRHPQVAECVVVSVPQAETLRRLRAFIIPASAHSSATADELRIFLKDKLSPYKIPRTFEFCTSLPRSATGKILRHALETL
jgi:acyl-coenzyme A synthetase/AMP-(fatty) acid ligase